MILACTYCGSARSFGQPCTACDDGSGIPSDEWMVMQISERVERMIAASRAAPAPADATPISGHCTFADAAERLHLDRVKTIPRLVEAGILRAVPWGEHERRILTADVDRVLREGLPTIPGRARKPPKGRRRTGEPAAKPRRRRARSNGLADSIRSIDLGD